MPQGMGITLSTYYFFTGIGITDLSPYQSFPQETASRFQSGNDARIASVHLYLFFEVLHKVGNDLNPVGHKTPPCLIL